MDIRRVFTQQLNFRFVDQPVDPALFEGLPEAPAGARVQFEGRGVQVLRVTLAALRGDAEKACIRALRRHYPDAVYLFADSKSDTGQTSYHLCNDAGKQLALTPEKQRLFMEKVAFFEVTDDVTGTLDLKERIAKAFETEKITRRFYDEFAKYRELLLDSIEGIAPEDDRNWYTSVLLNRLMFIYFIQKHGFIGTDADWLRNRLAEHEQRGADFYADFLIPLFFHGFAQPSGSRGRYEKTFADVPYLNGGLFEKHEIEIRYSGIAVGNAVLRRLLDYFEKYRWYLDERPLGDDNEINPDVLGYIFEKYVNQKQMGAYYTKEDITGYICRNTILPFLLDKQARLLGRETSGGAPLPLPITAENIDRYIYEAVQTEAHLPTETEREYAARRKRCEAIRRDAAEGRIAAVNDLITYNLDIVTYADDALAQMNEHALQVFYFECLQKATVLDPTAGSGAFLFAALNILLPLYLACIGRMRWFAAQKARAGGATAQARFRDELARIARHPNERYYTVKTVIVNNLYGVDIMEEAVEICRLRLFLRLAAEIRAASQIEPLPDIDFNIKAGNTLVGFAARDGVARALTTALYRDAVQGRLISGEDTAALDEVERQCRRADQQYQAFHSLQTGDGVAPGALAQAKADLRRELSELNDTLNRALAREYGVTLPAEKAAARSAYQRWLDSHQPFLWFAEFYGILSNGGFDVIVGNPPYLDFKDLSGYTVLGYETLPTRNVYPLVLERCQSLSPGYGRQGYIVPVSSVATEGYISLQRLLVCRELWFSSFDDRPSHLFSGLDKNTLSILLLANLEKKQVTHSTRLLRWSAIERDNLFDLIQYEPGQEPYLVGCLPKLGNDYEISIWNKIFTQGKALRGSYSLATQASVYYSRKVNAFLQILDFVPEVRDGNGRLRPPSEFKVLHFDTIDTAAAAMCCLNSTLFRWFLDVVSDGSHLNRREVDNFPFEAKLVAHTQPSVVQLAQQLSKQLQATTEHRVMRYKHDTLTVQCIYPKYSKPTIDSIDQVLAQYYGFTDEELDFIINYDIKYRMGRDADVDTGE